MPQGCGRSRESKFRAILMTVTEAEAIAGVVSVCPELIFGVQSSSSARLADER